MWPAVSAPWVVAGAALLGWVWGSFLNQLIDRTPPRTRDPEEATPVQGGMAQRPTLLHPVRSVCFRCGAGIAWYDNLPIFSYLLLAGRCRRCAGPIGRRTLGVEFAVPLIGGALAWAFIQWPAAPFWWVWLPALCSWLLVTGVTLAERRRFGRIHGLAAGALGVAVLFL